MTVCYKEIYEKAHAESSDYQQNNMGIRLYPHWKDIPLKGPLLEVGCGNGKLCQKFFDEKKMILGMDIINGYERAYPFIKCDVTRTPWPFQKENFGTAMAFDLIEHLELPDAKKVLLEMMRVSEQQIISIPDYSAGSYHVTVQPLPWWEDWLEYETGVVWNQHAVVPRNEPKNTRFTGIFTHLTKGNNNGTV